MWVILAGVVTSVIAAITFYQEKWGSPISSVNYSDTVANSVADNILLYTKLAKQYAEGNHLFNQPLDNKKIISYSTYDLNLMGNYRSIEFNVYSGSCYVLVSWDSLFIQVPYQKTITSLASKFTRNIDSSGNIVSVLPQLFIVTNGCNANLINAYQGYSDKKSGAEKFFKEICLNLPSNYQIGKYNLLIQSVRN